MDKKEDQPRYKDEFEEYTMAVAMIRILCRKGLLPESVYETIKKDHEKDVELYRKMC